MFTTLFSLSLFVALIHSVLAQSDTFTVYTPSLTECQPTSITWTDTGNPPYDVLIVPADDKCGHALMDLGNQTSTSVTCTPDIPAGTQVVISVLDAVGNEAWSGTIDIASSSDTSCLASNSSSYPSRPISGILPTSGTPTPSLASTSTALAPAGAAGAGLVGSGSLSASPLSSVTLLGSVVLAVVAYTL